MGDAGTAHQTQLPLLARARVHGHAGVDGMAPAGPRSCWCAWPGEGECPRLMHTAFLARDAPSQPTCDGGHPNRWPRVPSRRSLAARVFSRLRARAGWVRGTDAAFDSGMLHLASGDNIADKEQLAQLRSVHA